MRQSTTSPQTGEFFFGIDTNLYLDLLDREMERRGLAFVRYRARVREFWDGCSWQPLRERIANWQRYVSGWWQYFQLGGDSGLPRTLSKWTRRHIRKALWLRWHDWRGRRNALQRLGATGGALRLAHGGRGAWWMALALNSVPTNARLRIWGVTTSADFADALL